MHRWRGLVGTLVALLFVTHGAGAAAQEVDARAEFLRGQTAYQQGDFARAVEAWERAYEVDPRPLLLFNLAQAHERLGQLTEAAESLEEYLDRAEPDDENQSAAREKLASLRQRLARTGIVVVGAPDGASIVVDGEPHSRAPRPDPIPVSPGAHQVDLRLEGYRDFRAAVVVPPGQTVEVQATMELTAGGAEAEDGPSLLPFVLMGGGAAVIAGGVVVGLLALGATDDADDVVGEDADSARSLALVADVMFGVGAAAAVTGLVLLLMDDQGTERGPDLASLDVGPMVGDGTAGAVVGGKF